MKRIINEIKPIHPWRFLLLLVVFVCIIFLLFLGLNKFLKDIENVGIIISFLLGISSIIIFDILKKQWFSPLIKIKSWEDTDYLCRKLTGHDLYAFILEIENTGNAVAEHCEISLSIENFKPEHIVESGHTVIHNAKDWIPVKNETIPWVFLSKNNPEQFIDINPSAKYKIVLAQQQGIEAEANYEIKAIDPQKSLVRLKMYDVAKKEITYDLIITVTGKNFSKITKNSCLTKQSS